MIFFVLLQRFYKSYTTNFLDQHDNKVALYKYFWKKWLIFGLLTLFLACLTMIAASSMMLKIFKKWKSWSINIINNLIALNLIAYWQGHL
jgi:hypothetical protein